MEKGDCNAKESVRIQWGITGLSSETKEVKEKGRHQRSDVKQHDVV